jgi:hypothetical protein
MGPALPPALAAALLAGCAAAGAGPPRLTFSAAHEAGPVAGFDQVPEGGAPGTTSRHRPRLSEVGVRRATATAAGAAAAWGDDRLFLDARSLRMSGGSILERPLTTHGTTFPAGTEVDGEFTVRTLWLGYGRRIPLLPAGGTSLDLVPSGGAMLWSLDHVVEYETGAEASRSFSHAAPFLGVALEAAPAGRFSFDASARAALPLATGPFDLVLEARVLARLWGAPDRGGRLFLGAVLERMSKKDKQTVPNDLEITFGPALEAGIEIDF